MKSVYSILLLLLLFFNLVGYKFYYQFLNKQYTINLNSKIENQLFNNSELVELQIPLNMPYYSDTKMENVTGEVSVEGKHYNYVKRKIQNNVLHIWCIQNQMKDKIAALQNQVATINTSNEPNNTHQQKQLIQFIKTEYIQQSTLIISISISNKLMPQYILANTGCTSLYSPSGLIKPPSLV